MKRLKTYEFFNDFFGREKKSLKVTPSKPTFIKNETDPEIKKTEQQSQSLQDTVDKFLKDVGVNCDKRFRLDAGQTIWQYQKNWIISISWWSGFGEIPVKNITIDIPLKENRRQEAGEDPVERDFPFLKNYLYDIIAKIAYEKGYHLRIYPSDVYDIIKELDVEKFELYKATKSYNL